MWFEEKQLRIHQERMESLLENPTGEADVDTEPKERPWKEYKPFSGAPKAPYISSKAPYQSSGYQKGYQGGYKGNNP
jgi:hypothetical protein